MLCGDSSQHSAISSAPSSVIFESVDQSDFAHEEFINEVTVREDDSTLQHNYANMLHMRGINEDKQ